MATDYDVIAGNYKLAKQQAWRGAIESFTLMQIVGDPAGKTAVDLACGEGFYARALRNRGAVGVVGVDLSEGMIALALAEEAVRPMGIAYLVGDGKDLRLEKEFDLVVAAYLLNYARDRDELGAMCRGVARCLKPGGRFVAVNSNPEMDFANLPSFREYGFEVEAGGKVVEGTPVTWTFHLETGPVRVENYRLGVAAHEEAFRSAGLQAVKWRRPRADPDWPGDWGVFLANPPIAFLECVKGQETG